MSSDREFGRVLYTLAALVPQLAILSADSIGDNADVFTKVLDYQPTTVDVGQDAFNQMFWDSDYHIMKRECTTCTDGWDVIYYKRYTMLDSFDLYTYTYDWENTNNVLGTDFDLFSTLSDALSGSNPWAYCNYNDNNIGMFRDCGPTGGKGGEWTSKYRGGDTASFFIYTRRDTTIDPTADPTFEPTQDPTRDCSVFHIDEFLMDCSVEFDGHGAHIDTLKSDVATMKDELAGDALDIAALQETVSKLVNATTELESTMNAMNAEMQVIVDYLDRMGDYP